MRISSTILLVALILFALCMGGCSGHKKPLGALHFTAMPASQTGIDFNNKITESDSINVYENEYMYNGSGVGIGDFNNDGLADVLETFSKGMERAALQWCRNHNRAL